MRSTAIRLWMTGAAIAMLAGCVVVEPEGGPAPGSGAQGPAPSQGPASSQVMCTMNYRPVCGQIDNLLPKTYSNSCVASNAGATIINNGECKPTFSVIGRRGPLKPRPGYKRLKGFEE
ncbi:Kazal-type serine protease inhibitor [Chelatococcus sp. YT9]|uniref:Kazal-type serine protease inhibitor family protein n=1 Tax=Chelatococcus sp. TaxID=1953771 RepID=UPI001BCE75D5|nr:hypothetical protein [Chelatococcus sp. YT9]MBX3557769.1 hypothetical protein [Chelatococcus sp.]